MCSTDVRAARAGRARGVTLALTAGALATTACASTSAPRDFLPDPVEAQSDAFGSWIDVSVDGDGGTERIQGELIAIDDETTWVLGSRGARAFPTASIVAGRFVAYDAQAGAVGSGAILGFVSTISNGVFLLLTGPMWILGGSVAASHQSRVPIHDLTQERPASMGRFARFPGGLPEGLDPTTLEGKPGR